MIKNIFRLCAATLLCCVASSCVMTQQQFGFAVQDGDVATAAATIRPGYANRPIYVSNDRYVLPMQYAIGQNNSQMADLLLSHGAFHYIGDRNLAHYSSLIGQESMARFFVKRGIGRSEDVNRGRNEKLAMAKRQREQNQAAAQFLGILGAAMFGGGGSDSGGRTQHEWDTYSAMRESGQIQ